VTRVRGGAALRSVGLVVAYAAAGLLAVLVAGLLAARVPDTGRLLAARAVLVTVGLVAVTLVTDGRRPLRTLLALAVAGYALCPATWVGRTYLAQLWFAPGALTVAIDLVAWVAVAAATGAALRRRRAARPGATQ